MANAKKAIGSIFATLTLNAKQFKDSLMDSTKRIEDFSKDTKTNLNGIVSTSTAFQKNFSKPLLTTVAKVSAGFTAFGAVLVNFSKKFLKPTLAALAGVATVVAGLSVGLKNAFKEIDETAKTSKLFGLKTQDFIGLSLAADFSGTTLEAFKAGSARLADEIKKINEGENSPFQNIFKDIGIDAKDLENAGFFEIFLKISDAIKSIENPTEKARVAFRLFGEQGVKMINLLNLGSEGIREQVKEADRLRIGFSDLEADAISNTNVSINKLLKSFKGLFFQIAIKIAPSLKNFVDRFVELIKNSNFFDVAINSISSRLTVFFDSLIGGIDIAVRAVQPFFIIFQSIQILIDSTLFGITKFIEFASSASAKLSGVKFFQDFSEKSKIVAGVFSDSISDELDSISTSIDIFSNGLNSGAFYAREFGDVTASSFDKASAGVRGFSEEFSSDNGFLKKLKEQIQDVKNEIEDFGVSEIEKKIRDVQRSFTEDQLSVASPLIEEYRKQLEALDGLKKAQEELKRKEEERLEAAQKLADEYRLSEEKAKGFLDLLKTKEQKNIEEFKAKQKEVNELLSGGFLKEKESQKILEKLADDLGLVFEDGYRLFSKPLPIPTSPPPSALRARSAESLKLLFNNKDFNKQPAVEKKLDDGNRIAGEQLKALKGIQTNIGLFQQVGDFN